MWSQQLWNKIKNAEVWDYAENIILPVPTEMRICTENDLGQNRMYINCQFASNFLFVLQLWLRLIPRRVRKFNWSHCNSITILILSESLCHGRTAIVSCVCVECTRFAAPMSRGEVYQNNRIKLVKWVFSSCSSFILLQSVSIM